VTKPGGTREFFATRTVNKLAQESDQLAGEHGRLTEQGVDSALGDAFAVLMRALFDE
jgi:hypothetical protein